MDNSLFTIQKPWNLEGDMSALPQTVEPPKSLPLIKTAADVITPAAPAKDVLKSEMMDIFNKVNSKKDPFETRTEQASLSDRYAGRSVSYGDYQIDPKSLDERYSKTQSWGEQAYNNIKVGLANGGSMFLIGTLGLPDLLDNMKSGVTGEAVEQSNLINNLYDWRKSVEENNTNFLNEQDNKTDAWNTIKNVLLPGFMTGSSGGWGKIFESAMYGVGAMSAVALQEIVATAIAPGLGNALVLSGAARMLNNVESIRKYAKLVDNIIDTSRVLNNVKSGLGTAVNIKNAARFAYATTIGANGEAAFEGIEGDRYLNKDLIDKYTRENGHAPTGKDLESINTLSRQAGSARYWTNMALLIATNALQFKRLFRNLDLAREANEQLAKNGLRVGLDASGSPIAKKAFELKSDWWNHGFQKNLKSTVEAVGARTSSDLAKESFSEGFEEFSQGWIDKSVNSYYTWKLDHRGQPAIDQALKSIGEGFQESWNTEGLANFLSGAVAGVGQQAVMSLPNAHKQIELSKKRKDELNSVLGNYKNFSAEDFIKSYNVNSVRGTVTSKAANLNATSVADEVAEGAVDNNDKKLYKDMETLNFFLKAEPYVSRGHSDILKDQFKFSLENMTEEDVQGLFNNENITKTEAIADFNQRVDDVNQSYSSIKQAFKNPYRYNSKNPSDVAKYWIFENEFIPELAYLDHRVKSLNTRRNEIEDSLGEYYSDMKYFRNMDELNTGKAYINSKIEVLKSSDAFLKLMSTYNEEFKSDYVKEKYLVDTYTESLKLLEEFTNKGENATQEDYNNFLNTYHDAFTIEHDQVKSGFYDRDEVMQKLSDHDRITNDIDSVQKMLKTYLSKDGEALFTQGFVALSNREMRKREMFNMSADFKTTGDEILKQFPNLTKQQVQDILDESADASEAMQKAKDVNDKLEASKQKIEDTKGKIREKFIAADKAEYAEDFIDNSKISALNEKRVLQDADDYIAQLNDKAFGDFREAQHNKFIENIRKLNPTFDDGGMLDTNKSSYDNLSTGDKIKYHNELINLYTNLKNYKGAPKGYINQQNKLIKDEQDLIKAIKAIPVDNSFSETIGDYEIIKDIKTGKYNLSENNKFINSFNTYKEAKDYIEEKIAFQQYTSDLKFDNINNLENKTENDYYDPETFDENGNRIIDKQDRQDNKAKKAALYNKLSRNESTNEDINQAITQNAKFSKYTLDGRSGTTQIFAPSNNDESQLPQEKILTSNTTDAIVLSYIDEELGEIPLNTYKHPISSLGFVSEGLLRKELSNTFASKGIAPKDISKYVANLAKDNYLFTHVTTRDDAQLITNSNFKVSMGTGISSSLTQLSNNGVMDQITKLIKGEVVHRDTTNNSLALIAVPKAELDKIPGKDVATKFEDWLTDNGHVVGKEYSIPNNLNAGYLGYNEFIPSERKGRPVETIIDFLRGKNYFEFLLASTVDPTVYQVLQAEGVLRFKGTPQEQIDAIMEKQKIFDRLINSSTEDIKRDFIFEREYTSINYKDVGEYNIDEIVYPFALLKQEGDAGQYNNYTFYLINENINSSDLSNLDVSFVGLIDDYKKDAKNKIIQSITARYKNPTEIFRGYYMLTTDSSGSPATYKLKAKEVDNESFLESFLASNLDNVTILANNEYLKFNYSEAEERFNINDTRDNSVLYIKYPIKNITHVNNLKNKLLVELSKNQNWFKDSLPFNKSLAVDNLVLSLSTKNETKPVDVNEIISTRQVTGINRNNYMVSKIVPEWRENNIIPDEPTVVSNVIENIPPAVVNNTLQYNAPYFFNAQEIDTFVGRIDGVVSTPEQLKTAIVLAYKQNETRTDKAFYLNDNLNLKLLDLLAQKDNAKITGSLKQDSFYNKLNLFTDRMPYKNATPVAQDIEARVQELIKNCIR